MGTLFTTSDGAILTGLTAGVLTLNFTNGSITAPDGTVSEMNTSLQIISTPNTPITKCKSFMVFCSDADSVIRVGNVLTIADHQLTHVIHNYDFEQIQITIPANSTPDENQIAFMASDDALLNYEPHDYWHDRGVITGTSTTAAANVYTKHVGAYDDFYITTYNNNTGGSGNSIDVKIYYSEDGVTFFAEQGYTTAVTLTGGSYNSFATDRKHHFYRAEINSTSAGNHNDFTIYYNNVSVI
jgi:hypothetical protein